MTKISRPSSRNGNPSVEPFRRSTRKIKKDDTKFVRLKVERNYRNIRHTFTFKAKDSVNLKQKIRQQIKKYAPQPTLRNQINFLSNFELICSEDKSSKFTNKPIELNQIPMKSAKTNIDNQSFSEKEKKRRKQFESRSTSPKKKEDILTASLPRIKPANLSRTLSQQSTKSLEEKFADLFGESSGNDDECIPNKITSKIKSASKTSQSDSKNNKSNEKLKVATPPTSRKPVDSRQFQSRLVSTRTPTKSSQSASKMKSLSSKKKGDVSRATPKKISRSAGKSKSSSNKKKREVLSTTPKKSSRSSTRMSKTSSNKKEQSSTSNGKSKQASKSLNKIFESLPSRSTSKTYLPLPNQHVDSKLEFQNKESLRTQESRPQKGPQTPPSLSTEHKPGRFEFQNKEISRNLISRPQKGPKTPPSPPSKYKPLGFEFSNNEIPSNPESRPQKGPQTPPSPEYNAKSPYIPPSAARFADRPNRQNVNRTQRRKLFYIDRLARFERNNRPLTSPSSSPRIRQRRAEPPRSRSSSASRPNSPRSYKNQFRNKIGPRTPPTPAQSRRHSPSISSYRSRSPFSPNNNHNNLTRGSISSDTGNDESTSSTPKNDFNLKILINSDGISRLLDDNNVFDNTQSSTSSPELNQRDAPTPPMVNFHSEVQRLIMETAQLLYDECC